MSSGINKTSIVQVDASSTPAGPLSAPSISSAVEVLSSNGSTVLVRSNVRAPTTERVLQICQVRSIAEQLFTCSLDQPVDVSDRRFSVLRDFVAAATELGEDITSRATDIVKDLMEKTDHNIGRVLKGLGATDEMVQYAIVNKIDIGKLVGKVVTISMAVREYKILSTQQADAAPAEAQAIRARMNTVFVRAMSVTVLLPSFVKLVAPSVGPDSTNVFFFASYTIEVAGDAFLRDPYPEMSQRYRIVAFTSNFLGMVSYGALTYSLLMQEKQDPDSVLAKASAAAFGAQLAYNVALAVRPPIVAARNAVMRIAQAAAPTVRTAGRLVAYNFVALTGRIAEVFSFIEGRRD